MACVVATCHVAPDMTEWHPTGKVLACLQSGKADALLESGEMRMPGSCSICFGLYVDEYRDFPKFDYEVRSGPSSGELTRLC